MRSIAVERVGSTIAGLGVTGSAMAEPAFGALGGAWNYLASSLLALVVVIAVAVIGLKLLRRYGRYGGGGAGRLKVLDVVMLGTHERAVLLSVDETELLVGVSQGNVRPLLTPQSGAIGGCDAQEFDGLLKGRSSP